MTKPICMLISLAGLLILPATGPSMAEEVKDEEGRNCVSTRRLKNTAVIDDQNVLFILIGNKIFHNALPKRCISLAQAGRFTYGSLAGNICRSDVIRPLLGANGMEGAACRLGRFYPVTKENLPELVKSLGRPSKPPEPLPSADIEEISAEEKEDQDPTSNLPE